MEVVRRFDARVDRLWERLANRFALAVKRDARYLNWKYVEPPHVRYTSALLRRGDDVDGYVVYRHFREPQGRVTQIVDLLADPADERGIKTLARWVDREARMDDSDKIRCHVTNAAFRRVLRRSGYFVVKSGIDLTVKVNAVPVPKNFYDTADEWHFTLGDGRSWITDMSLEQTLSADIVTAMKARDATKLTALRMLKSALTNKSIEKGRALDSAEELQVVSTLVKQRRDSIEQFTKGGRQDLADKEQAEIGFLNAYQPAAASDEDVAAAVAAAIAETGATQRERHGQSHEGDDGCTRREDSRWQEGQRGREGEARLNHTAAQSAEKNRARAVRQEP